MDAVVDAFVDAAAASASAATSALVGGAAAGGPRGVGPRPVRCAHAVPRTGCAGAHPRGRTGGLLHRPRLQHRNGPAGYMQVTNALPLLARRPFCPDGAAHKRWCAARSAVPTVPFACKNGGTSAWCTWPASRATPPSTRSAACASHVSLQPGPTLHPARRGLPPSVDGAPARAVSITRRC